jgi:hypothetical protein
VQLSTTFLITGTLLVAIATSLFAMGVQWAILGASKARSQSTSGLGGAGEITVVDIGATKTAGGMTNAGDEESGSGPTQPVKPTSGGPGETAVSDPDTPPSTQIDSPNLLTGSQAGDPSVSVSPAGTYTFEGHYFRISGLVVEPTPPGSNS